MNLKDDKQQNIQMQLDFSSMLTGEAREARREETEPFGAMNGTENPASTNRLMEEVCERENLKAALQRVKANKGSPGVDGMTVIGIKDYLKQHWPAIREQLLSGTYEPKPVRRVEIDKPDGGVRMLGIPTASANCTGAQIAFRMGGDPPSVSSTSRAALSGFEGTPDSRH
jgi:RNA-directed DNA polymerase